MRMCAVLIALSVTGIVAADESKKDPPMSVTEIAIKAEGQPKGKVTEPTVISSEEELKKAFTNEEVLALITKKTDFTKQKVLYFGWSGSGRDVLTFAKEVKGDKVPELIFNFTGGLTRDLRGHAKAFIVPKDATFKVVNKK